MHKLIASDCELCVNIDEDIDILSYQYEER